MAGLVMQSFLFYCTASLAYISNIDIFYNISTVFTSLNRIPRATFPDSKQHVQPPHHQHRYHRNG